MYLNTEKCKSMRVGKQTPDIRYTIKDHSTEVPNQCKVTDVERDLRIIVSHDLKPRSQVHKTASKANRVLALLRNSFVSRNPIVWKKTLLTYVRSHLKYAFAAWNPYTKEDKRILEKIQKRATRVIKSLRRLTYKERQLNLGVTSQKGNMIYAYKI